MTVRQGAWRGALAVVAVAALGPAACWFEVEEDEADIQDQIQAMLARSAEEWNGGDLDGFMDDYLHSETITFIGSSGLVTGYDAVRARYAPSFEPGADRDSLRFADVATRRLNGLHGMVTARWILYRNGEFTASGPFTLIVRRTSTGWKIIHDHSSADAAPGPAAE